MAFITTIWCAECELETPHNHSKCTLCEHEEHAAAERAWQAMPIELKLADLHTRLQKLENAGPFGRILR